MPQRIRRLNHWKLAALPTDAVFGKDTTNYTTQYRAILVLFNCTVTLFSPAWSSVILRYLAISTASYINILLCRPFSELKFGLFCLNPSL